MSEEITGFINGYRWGVEYPTNGKQPDLDGDVVVEMRHNYGAWHGDGPDALGNFHCKSFCAFRITDERYKPADTSYLDAKTLNELFTAESSDIPRFNYQSTQFKLVDDSKPQNKYDREIIGKYGTGKCTVDVYRVLDAFKTDSAAIDHAVKKLLCAGSRGAKDRLQDLREALLSIEAEIDLQSDKQMECKQ